MELTWKGWPESVKDERFKRYFAKRQELSVESTQLKHHHITHNLMG